jgi:cytochrome c biogenesis protein CcmG, thiol:disulfide interchange protein DsbE
LTRPGRGTLSLLIVAALFAAGVGAFVVFRTPFLKLRSGSVAPDFSLPAHGGGSQVSLSAQRGKVVFVNFWATWCTPCLQEAPSLQKLYDQLKDEGFEILAVSIDNPGDDAKIEQFRTDYSITFPIALDPNRAVYDTYQVFGVPETFIIDASGRVIEQFVGPQDWADPRYSRAIRRALAAAKQDSGGSPGG